MIQDGHHKNYLNKINASLDIFLEFWEAYLKVLNRYDIDQFTYSNTCESTSETRITLVSRLVSKGKKDKVALSILQCIQQHIALSPTNQTTLDLALKLHYKFGGAEIVTLTHEHGLSAFMIRCYGSENQQQNIWLITKMTYFNGLSV